LDRHLGSRIETSDFDTKIPLEDYNPKQGNWPYVNGELFYNPYLSAKEWLKYGKIRLDTPDKQWYFTVTYINYENKDGGKYRKSRRTKRRRLTKRKRSTKRRKHTKRRR